MGTKVGIKKRFNRFMPVNCYDANGNFYKRYDSLTDVADEYGTGTGMILQTMYPTNPRTYKDRYYRFEEYEYLYPPMEEVIAERNKGLAPVYVFNDKGELIASYTNAQHAGREEGLSADGIKHRISKGHIYDGKYYSRKKVFDPKPRPKIVRIRSKGVKKDKNQPDDKILPPYVKRHLFKDGMTVIAPSLVHKLGHDGVIALVKEEIGVDVRRKPPIYPSNFIVQLLPTEHNRQVLKDFAKQALTEGREVITYDLQNFDDVVIVAKTNSND